MFMHASDHAMSLSHATSACRRSRSDSVTDRAVSPPAGVSRLSRSHSLPSTERQTDSRRDVILLQRSLSDTRRKLDNMRLALAAKVSTNALLLAHAPCGLQGCKNRVHSVS